MSSEQMTLLGIFGEGLDPNNRWMKLARCIPWDAIALRYDAQFDRSRGGHPTLPARVAFGSLIIQQRLSLTDEETVALIQENPYLQAFLGFAHFSASRPFDPSMMVHFRKRFALTDLQGINELIVAEHQPTAPESVDAKDDDTDDTTPPSESGGNHDVGDTSTPKVQGTLMMDATCVPADITYPTDLNLLNHARELTEQIIDHLHEPWIGERDKPRTYRQKARQAYLRVAKAKKVPQKRMKTACRKQLRYLKRNLSHLHQHISTGLWNLRQLDQTLYRKLIVIHEVVRQQTLINVAGHRSVENRIVSIAQPHVRPLVRGKAGKPYEFGAKIAVAHDGGFAFLEGMSWEAYHEAQDLIMHAEKYRHRHGWYPQRILADKIYRTRANRAWCKERGIRLAGLGPGRPTSDLAARREMAREAQQDEADRQPIEGVFGRGKRRFGLGRILTRLPGTSAATIALVLIVLNLERILYALFSWAHLWLRSWASQWAVPNGGTGHLIFHPSTRAMSGRRMA